MLESSLAASKPRILVIRGGAIGDFIVTLPVLAALRRYFPHAHLEVLGYPHIAHLAVAGGLADAVRPIEARALAGFFTRGGELDRGWCTYFGSFALILSYLYDPDAIFRENIAFCSAARFIACPHRPDEALNLHATEALLKPLESLAIFNADTAPRLFMTEPVAASRPEGRWLAMHPGSGSKRKNWPEAQWAGLIAHLLAETELKLLLVGGEAEGSRLDRLARGRDDSRVAVARSLALVDLAIRLRGCMAFIGHDSGISHLAAAVGLPCLLLWGPTLSKVWQPRGERVRILQHSPDLSSLPVEAVVEQLIGFLEGFPSSGKAQR
jgi:heptosyltransferase-2